ncbi:biopolymer transporter ExbD [bacterium]|nr:biopolymer transporter ExbD [bacterium]
MKYGIAKERRVDLISLIDMVFILVIFFMINNMTVQSENLERRFTIPTPKNERGNDAQVLIQIIDENRFFWIDHNDYSEIDNQLAAVWLPVRTRYTELEAYLREHNTYPWNMLGDKLAAVFEEMADSKCFIVIRCPNNIPYFKVIEVIKLINQSDIKTIEYGCIGGDLDDIFTLGNITSRQIREGNSVRRVIQISY